MRSWIEKLEQLNNEHQREILRLKSLCRRAAEEIRDLDDILIDCVENNKVPKYDEKDPMFAGFSSINLLNRLDAKTSGGYIENYPDLCLKLKELDGWYKAEHPSFYQSVNKVIDDHKETLQKLADNPSPYKHKTKDCVYFQETGGMSCPDCDEEPFNEKSTSNEEHTPECKWHKDWHACDCGAFDAQK